MCVCTCPTFNFDFPVVRCPGHTTRRDPTAKPTLPARLHEGPQRVCVLLLRRGLGKRAPRSHMIYAPPPPPSWAFQRARGGDVPNGVRGTLNYAWDASQDVHGMFGALALLWGCGEPFDAQSKSNKRELRARAKSQSGKNGAPVALVALMANSNGPECINRGT